MVGKPHGSCKLPVEHGKEMDRKGNRASHKAMAKAGNKNGVSGSFHFGLDPHARAKAQIAGTPAADRVEVPIRRALQGQIRFPAALGKFQRSGRANRWLIIGTSPTRFRQFG